MAWSPQKCTGRQAIIPVNFKFDQKKYPPTQPPSNSAACFFFVKVITTLYSIYPIIEPNTHHPPLTIATRQNFNRSSLDTKQNRRYGRRKTRWHKRCHMGHCSLHCCCCYDDGTVQQRTHTYTKLYDYRRWKRPSVCVRCLLRDRPRFSPPLGHFHDWTGCRTRKTKRDLVQQLASSTIGLPAGSHR